MKVSSPVGEFPFEPNRLDLEQGALVVHGSMGAWPATVRIDRADVPRLLRVIPWGAWVAILVLLLAVRRLGARR
jgi:hypothetical protein